MYLVQVLGYDLGYRFSWYLRGPYSRHLTEDAFNLRAELDSGDTDAEDFMLAESAKKVIGKAKKLWKSPSSPKVDRDSWLELLASLHYLKVVAYWPEGDADKPFESVFSKLIDSKPQFADKKDVAKQAWDRLKSFHLLPVA